MHFNISSHYREEEKETRLRTDILMDDLQIHSSQRLTRMVLSHKHKQGSVEQTTREKMQVDISDECRWGK